MREKEITFINTIWRKIGRKITIMCVCVCVCMHMHVAGWLGAIVDM